MTFLGFGFLAPVFEKGKLRVPAKAVRWVLLGLVLAAAGVMVLVVVALESTTDSSRDLADFASPAEARAFVSAHLPVPLPNDAVIESLHFERWTDWRLSATARLPSSEAVDRYLEQTKRDRKLNDEYCYDDEPPHGARYFLGGGVFACGAIEPSASSVIEIRCNTR